MRKNQGITLIALVITIVVLLILAGISIATLTGENGVLSRANSAKAKTVHETVKEVVTLKKSNYEMEKAIGEYKGSFIEYLEKETIIQDNIEETYKINVTNLIGEKQPLGNGTNSSDVYKLEKIAETEKYVINYYDKSKDKTEIMEINMGKIEENNKKPEQMEPTQIYAKTYSDGTTIFSSTDYEDSTHGDVINTYDESELNKNYDEEPPRWIRLNGSGIFSSTDFYKVIIKDKIAPTCTAYWFEGAESVAGIEKLITNNVTDMSGMFSGENFEELDLRNFDTSLVTSMRGMFANHHIISGVEKVKSKLIKLNISSFDTSKVTDMKAMFSGCGALETLDLSNFDTSKVTNMERMFECCKALKTLDLSNFDTSKVTNMVCMFSGCGALETLDLSSLDNELWMTGIFEGCDNLKVVYVKNEKIGELLKQYAPTASTRFIVK